MSLTLIQGGSFTSAGIGKRIMLPGTANYFKTLNLTQAATTAASGVGVIFEWFADQTPQGGAVMWQKTNSTNALNLLTITSGGFTYTPSTPPQGAALTGTTITAATPAVATVTNTFSNGDRVRIYGSTGMRQISGMAFTVSSVTSANVTLAGLPAAGFAAGATAFTIRKIPDYENVLPEYLFITAISTAAQAVVTVSTTHLYVAGMKIFFSIPAIYGMPEINNMSGTIVAIGTYTLTVDINSSGFTAFAFPASAPSLVQPRFATLAPDGQKAYYDQVAGIQYGYDVQYAPFRSVYGEPSMYLAAGVLSPAGSTSDIIEWQAFRYGG